MFYTLLSFILSIGMVGVGLTGLSSTYDYFNFPTVFFVTGLPLLLITIVELMLRLNIIKKYKMVLAYFCFVLKWIPLMFYIISPIFWIIIFIFIKSSLSTLNDI